MSAHTRGPWFTARNGFSTVYIEARIGGGMLQEVAACGPTAEGPDQQEANARLIAAAPDLLAALEALDSYICNNLATDYPTGVDTDATAFRFARATIAKATGEPA